MFLLPSPHSVRKQLFLFLSRIEVHVYFLPLVSYVLGLGSLFVFFFLNKSASLFVTCFSGKMLFTHFFCLFRYLMLCHLFFSRMLPSNLSFLLFHLSSKRTISLFRKLSYILHLHSLKTAYIKMQRYTEF